MKLLIVCIWTLLWVDAGLQSANATDWDWSLHASGVRPPVRRHSRPRHLYRTPEKAEHRDDGWTCLEAVRVVGSQWATESGAEDSARKAFMEEVRFRFGEQFMDIDHVRDYRHRCSRSSVGELAGNVLYRCEIAANPCKAPMKETGK